MAPCIAAMVAGIFLMTAFSDEGMWLLNDPPRAAAQGEVRLRPHRRLARTRAMQASVRFNNGGSGGVRLAGRADRHQPPHRRRRPAEAQHAGRATCYRDGFYAEDPRRGAEVPRPGAQRPASDRGRDRPGERRGQAGDEAGRGVRRPPGRHGRDREGVARQDRPAHATWSRSTRAGCITCTATRSTPTCGSCSPRRQASPSSAATWTTSSSRASTSTSLLPRLRGRQAGEGRSTTSSGATTGPEEGDLVFVTGHPGTTNRLETLAKLKHRRDVTLPYTLARLRTMEAALHPVRRARPGASAAGGRPTCTASPTPARRSAASTRGCSTRRSWSRRRSSESEPDPRQQLPRLGAHAGGPTTTPCGAIAEAQKKLRDVREAVRPARNAATPSTSRAVHASPGTSSGWRPRAAEAERPSGCASTATRTSSRSSSSSSRRPRSTPSWSGRSWPASLTFLAENLGGEHPLVEQGAGRQDARRRAPTSWSPARSWSTRPSASGSSRAGTKAVDASDRPDDRARAGRSTPRPGELRKRYEDEVEEPERQAYARDRPGCGSRCSARRSPRTRRSRCGWRSAS